MQYTLLQFSHTPVSCRLDRMKDRSILSSFYCTKNATVWEETRIRSAPISVLSREQITLNKKLLSRLSRPKSKSISALKRGSSRGSRSSRTRSNEGSLQISRGAYTVSLKCIIFCNAVQQHDTPNSVFSFERIETFSKRVSVPKSLERLRGIASIFGRGSRIKIISPKNFHSQSA